MHVLWYCTCAYFFNWLQPPDRFQYRVTMLAYFHLCGENAHPCYRLHGRCHARGFALRAFKRMHPFSLRASKRTILLTALLVLRALRPLLQDVLSTNRRLPLISWLIYSPLRLTGSSITPQLDWLWLHLAFNSLSVTLHTPSPSALKPTTPTPSPSWILLVMEFAAALEKEGTLSKLPPPRLQVATSGPLKLKGFLFNKFPLIIA